MSSSIPAPSAKKLAYNCPARCSLRVEVIGSHNAGVLKTMRENGAGWGTMLRRAEELLPQRVPLAKSVMQRHLKHYVETVDETAPPEPDGPRPTDLAILDGIIIQGFRNSRNWKPTIRDTLDAMKLKIQMTGQSAFEDMLQAMDAAFELPEDENESPEAQKSADEAAQEAEEPLDPPLAGE